MRQQTIKERTMGRQLDIARVIFEALLLWYVISLQSKNQHNVIII